MPSKLGNRNKETPESVIMENVLKALKMNYSELATSLGYKTHNSTYKVLKGISRMSLDMEDRLIEKFPELNSVYIKKGKGRVLREGAEVTEQEYIHRKYDTPAVPEPKIDMDELRLRFGQNERDLIEIKRQNEAILARQDELLTEIRRLSGKK